MGTMRNNFATVFVPLVLMLSTSQSLPHGYENFSKGNSFADDLTPDARTTLYPIHNCLFIDPDLPICDVERMLNSDEKTTEPPSDQYFDNDFDKDFATRSRRNADVSTTARVVVYTIEGCIPSRLPFSLPSCNGILLNNIVSVQRLRPFAVKGVTESPFVFPKFKHSRWMRMMARLQSQISSQTQDEEEAGVPKEVSVENSLEDRKDEMMIIPKGLLPRRTKRSKTNVARKTLSSVENVDSVWKTTSKDTNDGSSNMELSSKIYPKKKSLKKIEKQREAINKRTEGTWKQVPSDLGSDRNSRSFLQSHEKQKNNEISNDSNDLGPSEARSFRRRRRDIRFTGNDLVQGTAEESKAQGIASKSSARRFQSSDQANQLNIFNEQTKYSKNTGMEEQRIVSTTAIPGVDTENHGKRSKLDNPGFKLAIASRKESWRRSMMKDAALGKKHRNYSELPATASQ